jgi:hypothetical protein
MEMRLFSSVSRTAEAGGGGRDDDDTIPAKTTALVPRRTLRRVGVSGEEEERETALSS